MNLVQKILFINNIVLNLSHTISSFLLIAEVELP